MKINFKCYLCLSSIKIKNIFICESCYANLEKLKWIYCPRCGNEICFGCENLSEFKNIKSIFSYTSGLPEILVLAKDKNDYNARLLFYEMFFEITKNYITEILRNREYDYIVLPTLRKERVLNSYWHPADFFESIFKLLLIESTNENYNFKILKPLLLKKSLKQALIPSNKRMRFLDNFKYQKLFLDKNMINKTENVNISKILILDDVLTSGETAYNIKKLLENNLQRTEWDLLTLFRSIQKSKS